MYCSRTLTPSGGRVEHLRGGALGAMPRTKKVLTRAEAKAMALRDGVEQVVLTELPGAVNQSAHDLEVPTVLNIGKCPRFRKTNPNVQDRGHFQIVGST